MTVRVFIVDGHPLFRIGVRALLEDAATLDFVGEASTGEVAVDALQKLEPSADVVLVDHPLTNSSAIETIRMITSKLLSANVTPRVLVVSTSDDDDAVISVLRVGARGYLAKSVSGEELLRAIHVVANDGAVFCPVVASRLSQYFTAVHDLPGRVAFPDLTDRERQILDLVARGYANRRIARKLVLAEKTVRNHISHIFAKLQVIDRTEAAIRARDVGLGS